MRASNRQQPPVYRFAAAAALVALSLGAAASAFVPKTVGDRAASRTLSNVPPLCISDAAADLLYQEQEKHLISRGELEEELMAGKGVPIEANAVKVRGAGGGGGFGGGGGGGKKGMTKSPGTLKAEGKAHAKVLKKEGVVRIDGVLSSDLADEMREYAYALRKEAEEDVESKKVASIQRFADVLLRKDRCDLTLPLGKAEVISDALDGVLRGSAAGQTIRAILGKNPVLYELSTLISDPGSQRQNVHPDTPFLEGKGPVLYTCFIALQDVQMDMGPTTWLPGTHTAEAHAEFKAGGDQKNDLIKNTPAVLGTLPKGACAIFDSRCLHCGTANRAEDGTSSRALFYFSFLSSDVGYPGNPASIRSEIGGAKITMEDLEDDLASRDKGKGSPMIDRIGASLR